MKKEDDDLLEAAEDADPDSRFVKGVRDAYTNKGYITDKQREVLEEIVERQK